MWGYMFCVWFLVCVFFIMRGVYIDFMIMYIMYVIIIKFFELCDDDVDVDVWC